ncbi:MAG: hypothetical protein A2381_16450 [Bdellovibrionales bacterium RIFOXYB1_FULL_37_110]|nr:MAG: hypothetical protein A2381_16450 [Bdellovibrionales bacterium RIFOXYB1_FULL_37_110]
MSQYGKDLHDSWFFDDANYQELEQNYSAWIWMDDSGVKGWPINDDSGQTRYTSDKAVAYPTLNQAFVTPFVEKGWDNLSCKKPTLTLTLSHPMPWFSHYQININSDAISLKASEYQVDWKNIDHLQVSVVPN